MSIQNNQLFDVAGRTQSPYIEKEVFAATALQYDFSSSTIAFTLPSAKVVSNINANITTLTVDWGDGLGNRTYSVGQTVSISYSTSGKKLVTINYTKPDGGILKSRFEISVASFDVTLRSCTDANYSTVCTTKTTIIADRAFQGIAASADVTIAFACPDQKLRKPFIILDGFDPDFFINSTTFSNVLDIMRINNSPTNNALGVDLKAAGYDLVFVDWNNRQDYIQRNAYLLEKILQVLKTKKQNDSGSGEKNVMMGLSMGRVVGKYALRDLEILNPNALDGGHDTRLYITYDSPLQGANIPLGLQYALQHLGNADLFGQPLRFALKDENGNPSLDGALKTLASPAAKQMILYQASSSPSPFTPTENIAFYNEFNAMGALTKCDFKNITNGSTIGVLNFAAGSKLLNLHLGTAQILQTKNFSGFWSWVTAIGAAFLFSGGSIDVDVFALPDRNPNSKVIYDGSVFYSVLGIPFFNTYKVEVTNTRPLDNGPGGTTGLGSNLIGGSGSTLRATFIPVASALDVRAPENQNINLDVSNEQTFLALGLTGSKGYVGTRGIGNGGVAGGFSNSDNGLRIRQDGTNLLTGPNNQEHISLSYRLAGFLLYELTQRSSLSTLPSFILNNRTYNFGSSNQPYTVPQVGQSIARSVRGVIDFPLVVSNTGLLWVNRSGKIEFTDVSTIDNKTNTRYDLNINSQGCSSGTPSVTLQNGGKMRAGDDLQGNYANVTVWNGATINVNAGGEATYEGGSNLIVESGGVVNIRDGGLQDAQWGGKVIIRNGGIIHVWNGGQLRQSIYSLLEIENGGQLIIDAGANIQLWDGANGPGGSTIDGRCGIIVKNGGKLIFNGQPNLSGNGYFRFEQGHILTLNSDILLRGAGRTIQMIRIADGASIVINGRRLTLENGLVRRETGSTPSKHIKLINGSSIQATNVTFEDNSTFGDRAFVYAENPTDPDNSTTDVDYAFTNCIFQGNGNLVQLNTLTAIPNDYEWLNLNVDFTDCTFTGGTAFNANRCRIATFLRCQLNNSGIILSNAYWLDMRQTTMRGSVSNPIIFNPSASTAIKLKTVIHGEIYDNSTIDNYNIGIDATEGWNNGVKLMSGAKIQNCYTAVKLIGGINNAYGFDWGMMYMDCASLINNVYGITGKDIQFNMYGRGGTTIMQNVSTDIQQNLSNWRYVDAEFQARVSTTDVWLHDSYWTGVVPNAGTQFRFIQRNPHFPEPWTGTLHLNNPILNDPNTGAPNDFRIAPCGGLGLRGSDPFSGKTEIILNGGRYDTKVQHDAAMIKMREKNFDQSVNLFRPLANVPAVIYERSSPEARHFIDNARIWVSYKGLTPRGANEGWLPEAFVGFTRKIDDLFILKPNPVNAEFEIQILAGSYEISVYDALGKLILLKNTEGVTQVNTADWQNGVYFVKVSDKSSSKVQNSKVIVQH